MRVSEAAHEADPHRRAKSLRGALGLTALSAVVPGAAYLWSGRLWRGALVLGAYLVVIYAMSYAVLTERQALIRLLVQTDWLTALRVALVAALLAWIVVVVSSQWMVRPRAVTGSRRVGEIAVVGVFCLALAVPFGVAVRYASAQRDFIDDTFASSTDFSTATRPVNVTPEDPWGGRERVTVLLLGSDAGPNRTGARTDTILVASTEVDTGRTVLFGLPRNLEKARFAPGTPLRELYPHGFDGPGDPAKWMLNAVYGRVPKLHPGILGASDNQGADALKLAASGTLGIRVDYYAMINLRGFVELIDAMGGVRVNVNEPIPIGGVTGVREPEGYIEPGPNKLLDGFHALWFARGRYGLDDYDRMRRQRCLVEAMIDSANPVNLLTRFERILDAGRELLRTDIPRELLPALVDLAAEVRDHKLRSVVFARTDRFAPDDPDIAWMHAVVQRALDGRPVDGSGRPGGGAVKEEGQSCAYDPVE